MSSLEQHASFGELLRQWREHRRMSQMSLALEAEISTRHLSFVENGKSAPSREMVLNLAEPLELSLRERNRLLLAAGYAPVYTESRLDSADMAHVRRILRTILKAHEPHPALVVDRIWNIVDRNEPAAALLTGVDPSLLETPNAMRITLHPGGLAPRIVNLAEWRSHLLERLARQIEAGGGDELRRLRAEVSAYPYSAQTAAAGNDLAVPLRLRTESGELAFLSTVTTFGTPLDVTLEELSIEAFFPLRDG